MGSGDPKAELAACEALRLEILRGDLVIGILPVSVGKELVERYLALAKGGVPEAWLGLGEYQLTENGAHFSVEEATLSACRALANGVRDAVQLLRRALPAFREAGFTDPKEAKAARRAVDSMLADDPTGEAHHLGGLLAFHGFGRKADVVESARLHGLSAALGNSDAMFELHVFHANGVGVPRDNKASLDWCRRAANRDHPRACYNLGAFYATGRGGVTKNLAAAHRWYRRASDADNASATMALAYMVSVGEGCEPDRAAAESLLQLAEDQGADVAELRAEIKRQRSRRR